MKGEYIEGRLTIHYMIDVVVLIHKVNGRVSYMDLVRDDFIEINEDDNWKTVTVDEILQTIVDSPGNWNNGRSLYHDSFARVKLDSKGNKFINSLEKRWKIKEVLTYLKHGHITELEAEKLLTKFELESD